MLKIFVRWTVFLLCLTGIYFFAEAKVQAYAKARLNSAVTVNIPDYTKEELILNSELRMKYILTRTRDIKFSIYKVKPGDNLWKIAKKHHYSVHTIIGCNPQMKTYDVWAGQKLLVPETGGNLHPVQPNDTWQTIADKYDIEESVLKKINYMAADELLKTHYIFIPGKRPAVDLLNKDMQDKYALRELFIWPIAGGRFTSYFGKRRHPVTGKISRHGGVDIAVKTGSIVTAAASGVVTVASTDVGHYGTAVFIDHKNGYVTHYGHLSKCLVRVGQKVKSGQVIARSGSTGRSTGPHLHFTVKKNGETVNPLKFLW